MAISGIKRKENLYKLGFFKINYMTLGGENYMKIMNIINKN